MQNSANVASQIPTWVPIVASLAGGGLMGAIITAIVTKYRNRRQPVGFKREVIEIFRQNRDFPSLQALLMVGSGAGSGPGIAVNNFSVGRITVINKGNQDFAEFKFGITLGAGVRAVDVKVETLDRHHVMEVLTTVSLISPAVEIDFLCKPFNRGEPYTANVYFTYGDEPGTIELSSSHSTKFFEIGATTELVKDTAIKALKDSLRNSRPFPWV